MKLFKTRWTDEDGTHTPATWYFRFRDHRGIVRRLAGFADKPRTRDLAGHVEHLVSFRARGLPPGDEEAAWLETLSPRLRARLAGIDLLDGRAEEAARPLAEHLADFRASLLARGCTARHADLVAGRAGRIIEGCGFKGALDVDAGAVERHLAVLRADKVGAGGKVKRGIGHQTSNFHVAAVQQFCRWLVDEGRAASSPVSRLDTLNVRVDRRHDRRALTVDELRLLLAAARGGPERHGMAGPERALLYRLAVETGLRAAELASLTRASFDLGGRPPTVTVRAAYSKHRREDVLPLRPDTAAALGAHLAGKMPAAPAFTMPARWHVIAAFKADLAAAGVPYVDGAGRFADFHALRHTFITNLVASGCHPKAAQLLARHGSIDLTMDRYTHMAAVNESAALAALPDKPRRRSRRNPRGGRWTTVDNRGRNP
ncbi:MAG: site-specific integrase [Planctomycetota bacterium]|nr:site-specific integrase [Planctomycetota bacterium]